MGYLWQNSAKSCRGTHRLRVLCTSLRPIAVRCIQFPIKKFQQQPIDKSKNRHIRYEQIAKLPQLQRLTTEIEQKLGNITVDSVWLIKKQKDDDGFQHWHQDMKHRISTTVVVNVGVVPPDAYIF